ncbi:hypothetical protein PMZ80_002798 [Knufia obscura]|uniref:DUF6590 domain-containing protein n=1 Tax=Knufia obscura TaxID=1635080 RepID=A0ABR0RZ93_9EURO|nr:hypothetical protein PMZ80_002798 [Knufia obscura]
MSIHLREVFSRRQGRKSSRQKSELREITPTFPDQEQSRFDDLRRLIESGLPRYLRKHKTKITVLNIQQCGFSVAEIARRLGVLVSCNSSAVNTVWRYFERRDIVDELRPQNTLLPAFDVLVIETTLLAAGSRDVQISARDWDATNVTQARSACGILLRRPKENGFAYSTLSGLITIEPEPGKFAHYGLTTGHFCEDDDDFTPFDATAGCHEKKGDGAGALIDSDHPPRDSESDNSDTDSVADSDEACSTVPESPEDSHFENIASYYSSDHPSQWADFGRVRTTSYQSSGSNHDWALIELDFDPRQARLYNCAPLWTIPRLPYPTQLTQYLGSESLATGNRQSVGVAMTRLGHEPSWGQLERGTVRVMLASTMQFVDAYRVSMENTKGLAIGDSGAWVFAAQKGEVIGSVIGLDAFQKILVMPIDACLQAIKEDLRATSVKLYYAGDYGSPPKPEPVLFEHGGSVQLELETPIGSRARHTPRLATTFKRPTETAVQRSGGRHAVQQPPMSSKLMAFTQLDTRTECAAYCKQDPGIWREDVAILRHSALEALHKNRYSTARRFAERWLLLSRVQRMELAPDLAQQWLERVVHRTDSKTGFDQDIDDLIVVLTHAAESPMSTKTTTTATLAKENMASAVARSALPKLPNRFPYSRLHEPSEGVLSSTPRTVPRHFSGLRTRPDTSHYADTMTMATGISAAPYAYRENPDMSTSLHWDDGFLEDSTYGSQYLSAATSEPGFSVTPGSSDASKSVIASPAASMSTLLSDDAIIESMDLPPLIKNSRAIGHEKDQLGPRPGSLAGYGKYGQKDELNKSYYVRKGQQARAFFVRGRVFAMVWHENSGKSEGPNQSKVSRKLDKPFHTNTVTTNGVQIFSHLRRFVIVKPRNGYCWAIPINSYGDSGLVNKQMSTQEQLAHTIIYDDQNKPQSIKNEPKLLKSPIAVKMAKGETLSWTSRLHFDRPQSIDWNIKVKDLGMIEGKVHLRNLVVYFQSEFKQDEDTSVLEEVEEEE